MRIPAPLEGRPLTASSYVPQDARVPPLFVSRSVVYLVSHAQEYEVFCKRPLTKRTLCKSTDLPRSVSACSSAPQPTASSQRPLLACHSFRVLATHISVVNVESSCMFLRPRTWAMSANSEQEVEAPSLCDYVHKHPCYDAVECRFSTFAFHFDAPPLRFCSRAMKECEVRSRNRHGEILDTRWSSAMST